MELAQLEDIHLDFCFVWGFLLAVNKLITDKTPNLFCLIAKYSGFMKYTWNKLDWII